MAYEDGFGLGLNYFYEFTNAKTGEVLVNGFVSGKTKNYCKSYAENEAMMAYGVRLSESKFYMKSVDDSNKDEFEKRVNDFKKNHVVTIREVRSLSGMSQVNFAKEYGIPLRTLQSWESGERKPAPYIIDLIIRVVNAEKKGNINM